MSAGLQTPVLVISSSVFSGCGQGRVTTFLGLSSHIFEIGINVITSGYHLQSYSMFRVQSILGLLFHLLLTNSPIGALFYKCGKLKSAVSRLRPTGVCRNPQVVRALCVADCVDRLSSMLCSENRSSPRHIPQ